MNAPAATCESLAALSLPNTTTTRAQTVSPGAFVNPAVGRGRGFSYASLPAFCRVAATLKPSSDSDIKIEVWLPASAGWNGKLQAVGNRGGAGGGGYAPHAAENRAA